MKVYRMKRSKKAAAVFVVLVVAGFGYWQYAAASQIDVSVSQSQKTDLDDGASYQIQLSFDNPSLLYLTAGQTEFSVYLDGEHVGEGKLDPFVLPSVSSAYVDGTFETYRDLDEADELPKVRISGVTKYNAGIASIEVPFVFYPTNEQAREFINQD